MASDDSADMNRRKMLKKAGAITSAAATVTLPSNVTAKEQVSKSTAEKALDSGRVNTLAEELGQLELSSSQSIEIEITSEEHGGAAMLTQAIFFVDPGAVVFTETYQGKTDVKFHFGVDRSSVPKEFDANTETTEKYTSFSWKISNDSTRRIPNIQRSNTPSVTLPSKYRSIPKGTNAMLITTGHGDVVFRRNATEQERKLVRNHADMKIEENTAIVVGSDIEGFHVTTPMENGEDAQSQVLKITSRSAKSIVPTQQLATQAQTVETSTEITTQDHEDTWYNHPCFGPCAGCGGSLGSCLACSPACAGSVTGVGAVACAACLFAVCHGVLVATCAACADCFTDHPP